MRVEENVARVADLVGVTVLDEDVEIMEHQGNLNEKENNMNKHWYASKTVWFNVLAGAVAVATLFGYTGDFSTPEIADKVNSFLPVVAFVGNLILRFVTKKPVGV